MDLPAFFAIHPFLAIGIVATLVAFGAAMRDWMNTRRRDLDKVSLISWGMVSTLALILAIVCFAVSLRSDV